MAEEERISSDVDEETLEAVCRFWNASALRAVSETSIGREIAKREAA